MHQVIAYVRKLRIRHLRKAIAGGLAGVVPVFAKAITDLHVDKAEGGLMASGFVVGFGLVFFARANDPVDVDPAPGQD